MNLKEEVQQVAAKAEKKIIAAVLKTYGGNVTHAARAMNVSRRSLQLKMKGHDLR